MVVPFEGRLCLGGGGKRGLSFFLLVEGKGFELLLVREEGRRGLEFIIVIVVFI